MENDLFNTRASLEKIGISLVEALRVELAGQGHQATGNLINGIEYEVLNEGDGYTLNIKMDKYGIYINNGVVAEKIPYNRGSGAKTSMYINSLIAWITQKGLESGDKNIRSFAFAIANKHKTEGMPTRGSYKYSSNGRRIGFIDTVLEENKFKIANDISYEAINSIDIFIDNLVKKANGNNNK